MIAASKSRCQSNVGQSCGDSKDLDFWELPNVHYCKQNYGVSVMRLVWSSLGICASLLLVSCGASEVTSNQSPTSSMANSEVTKSAAPAIGERINSGRSFLSMDELVRGAQGTGLECQQSKDLEYENRAVRVCDSTLLIVHFSRVGPESEELVKMYLDRGWDVIRGEAWFVTAPPERIEPLVGGMTN